VRYRLLCVDRIREQYVAAAAADFAQRLGRYDALEIVEVPSSKGTDPAHAVREESAALSRRLEPSEQVWLLERTGTQLSSVELTGRLAKLATEGR
jgi:23S rRNA (pseudouridine1915-N3)-methyltransferase